MNSLFSKEMLKEGLEYNNHFIMVLSQICQKQNKGLILTAPNLQPISSQVQETLVQKDIKSV